MSIDDPGGGAAVSIRIGSQAAIEARIGAAGLWSIAAMATGVVLASAVIVSVARSRRSGVPEPVTSVPGLSERSDRTASR